jgi:hypothetical protein
MKECDMRPLTQSDPVGTRVLYVGRADASNVADDALVAAGRVLEENHPGIVTSNDEDDGVRVQFLGLEHEPIAGEHFLADDSGNYPGLVVVGLEDWMAARSVGWWAGLPLDVPDAG